MPWDRQTSETSPAYEAFEIYRSMGGGRSLAKVARQLGKSTAIVERWSRRHGWVDRCVEWDRHEARRIHEHLLSGVGAMRLRQVVLAQNVQSRVQERVLGLTAEEVKNLRPCDIAVLMRVSTQMEYRARQGSGEEFSFPAAPEFVPHFEVQVITPGSDKAEMIAVQLEINGQPRFGYIRRDQMDRFLIDYPSGVVIV